MTHPTISRREWRSVLLFACGVMLLTSIPYLVGFALQDAHQRFGGFTFALLDSNSYLAKMRQGTGPDWLFHIAYTSEPHDGSLLFTPYLAAGKLLALFISPSDPAFVDAMLLFFHLCRIACGVLLVTVTYRFVAAFLRKRSLRWLALIVITLGGGFGWILVALQQVDLLGTLPIDLLLPEGYTFYLLYGLPHLSLARACLLGGLLLTFQALRLPTDQAVRPMLLAGLLWLMMGLCVPFYIAVLYAILGVWGIAALLRRRHFPLELAVRAAIGAILPLPYLLYNLYVFATNPVLRDFSAQNYLPSPHPLHYVLGYGLLAVLALPALRWGWRRGNFHTPYLLLPAWVVAGPILAYLPIAVQRRLLEAIFVPLCILGVMGLRLWWLRWRRGTYPRRARAVWQWAETALLILLLPTSLMVMFSPLPTLMNRASDLYHSSAQIEALDWLNAHAEPDSIVLSSFSTGNYIPARARVRSFMGHSPETLNLATKQQLAKLFFEGEMPQAAVQLMMQRYRIRYVVFDPGMTRPKATGLTQVFDKDGFTIYQVSILP